MAFLQERKRFLKLPNQEAPRLSMQSDSHIGGIYNPTCGSIHRATWDRKACPVRLNAIAFGIPFNIRLRTIKDIHIIPIPGINLTIFYQICIYRPYF